MKNRNTLPYSTAVHILNTAEVSNNIGAATLSQLAPDLQSNILKRRILGEGPIAVRWPTGHWAILYGDPVAGQLCARKIILAHQSCVYAKRKFCVEGAPT